MAAVDYATLAETAKTLIEQNGRLITFNRFNQTPGDNAKPWLGPTDPRSSVDATATISGVFVPPSGAAALGLRTVDSDLLKRTAEIAIVAPGSVSPPFDLATANEVVDGGVKKKVTFTETLKPGSTTVLYFVGVAR